LYHRALPQVYGYLLPRCGSAVLAEDLTAETFMAAVAAAGRDCPPELSRSLHATETLLVRARAALRRVYEEGEGRDA
jgi:hypothetical protein